MQNRDLRVKKTLMYAPRAAVCSVDAHQHLATVSLYSVSLYHTGSISGREDG